MPGINEPGGNLTEGQLAALAAAGATGLALAFTTSNATTFGARGVTPVAMPTAYTQTYSTAARTVPADTSHTITDSSLGTPSTTALAAQSVSMTGVDGTGSNAASKADVDAVLAVIRNNISTLAAELALAKADALASKKVVNSLIDDLQAQGLAQ